MMASPIGSSSDSASSAPMSRDVAVVPGTSYRRKQQVLFALLGIHVVVSLFGVAPGHFTLDEGIYHMMSESFAHDGSLSVWNGYEEFPSQELTLLVTRPADGRLIPQYPHFYTFLAAPLYAVLGFRSLFLLNAIAFVGVVWLTFLLAAQLFRDRGLAINATLILALGTFAWEYSQAAWPHMTAALFIMTTVYCMALTLDEPRTGRSTAFALLAGLAAGIGAGMRLDTIFVVPAVIAWTFFIGPYPQRARLAFVAGLLPGLLLLATVNYAKFGFWSPFSYGAAGGAAGSVAGYLPPAAAGALSLLFIWGGVRSRRYLPPSMLWMYIIGGLAAIATLLAVVPQAHDALRRLFVGTYQLIVDLRVRDIGLHERALTRGPGGGMVYLGSLKKSLLQSCPYLVLLIIPLWQVFRGRDDASRLALPLLCIGGFVAVYGYFAWHGGLSFNLRYFLPILPLLSVLAAHAIRELPRASDPRWRYAIGAAVACTIAVHAAATFPEPRTIEQQEFIFLTMPLFIAGVMLFLVMLWALPESRIHRWIPGGLRVVLASALVWAGLTAFAYDMARSYSLRKNRVELAERIAPAMAPDSILFASSASPFFSLNEDRWARIAIPAYDEFNDFSSLVGFHLAAERPVYLFMDPSMSAELERRSLLDSLMLETIVQDARGNLVRVRPAATP